MKIVRPYARIIPDIRAGGGTGILGMRKIEWCARISHRAEDKQMDESWKRFLQSVVIEHGDWSVVEHVSVSVDMLVDRGITHELVRHRLFSFTQQSTRFINHEKKMPPEFIYPIPTEECPYCLEGNESQEDYGPDAYRNPWVHDYSQTEGVHTKNCLYDFTWLQAISTAETQYKALINKGWRPQEARSVFPNALASRIVTTGNLRNWRHLFIMRTTQETHPQFKQVSIPLLKQFQAQYPILFDDIEPNLKQSESMKKIR